MAYWKFTAVSSPGSDEFGLPVPGRSLTFRLLPGSISDGSFTLNRKDDRSPLLEPYESEILVRRDSQLLLRGPLLETQSTDEGDGTSETWQPRFADYRARMDTVWLQDSDLASFAFTGVDAGDIPRRLLTTVQAHPGASRGITAAQNPGPAVGSTLNQSFSPGQSYTAAVDQVAQQTIGFEWTIDPARLLQIAPSGFGAVKANNGYDYGGKIQSFQRIPQPYGNIVRVTGGSLAGGTALTPVTVAVPDIATRPEGMWFQGASAPDITDQATLARYANWFLNQVSSDRYSYTCVLKPGAWKGPSDLWLGDTVPLRIKSGKSLQVNTSARCVELDITPGDDGSESVTAVFGRPRSNYSNPFTAFNRRLADLERHT